jgi:hypothetical protein
VLLDAVTWAEDVLAALRRDLLAGRAADPELAVAELTALAARLTDQQELFEPVASVPTVWRALEEFGAGGQRIQGRVTAAVNAARAWAAIQARHGGMPPLRIADKTLPGWSGSGWTRP